MAATERNDFLNFTPTSPKIHDSHLGMYIGAMVPGERSKSHRTKEDLTMGVDGKLAFPELAAPSCIPPPALASLVLPCDNGDGVLRRSQEDRAPASVQASFNVACRRLATRTSVSVPRSPSSLETTDTSLLHSVPESPVADLEPSLNTL